MDSENSSESSFVFKETIFWYFCLARHQKSGIYDIEYGRDTEPTAHQRINGKTTINYKSGSTTAGSKHEKSSSNKEKMKQMPVKFE